MKKIKNILLIGLVTVVVFSCSQSIVSTTWKNDSSSGDNYDRIMVVAIMGEDSDSLRMATEKYFTLELRNLGYNAVGAYNEFGHGGLKNLTEEATYLSLCNKGVDAVITIALVDQSKNKEYHGEESFQKSNIYYYQRIWNYRNLQPDSIPVTEKVSPYFCESILFNLRTLEAECVVQSRLLHTITGKSLPPDLEKKMIKKMLKERVLKKQNRHPLKGF
jgi:hypothetical protein